MSDAQENGMQIHDGGYYLSRRLELGFDEALERAKQLLVGYGFGIQWETDVQNLMREKLNKEYPRYTIVGACRPYEADIHFSAEPWIGALMPCNVVVRQDEQGQVWVGVKHPGSITAQVGNEELYPVAAQLTETMREFLEEL